MHEVFVDYLQFSAPFPEADLQRSGVKMITPIKFFKRGYKDEIGCMYFFGHHKTKDASIVLSGVAMHNQRVIGWDDSEFIEATLLEGGIVKRLDIAITDYVENDLITPSCVVESFYANELSGTLINDGVKFIAGGTIDDFPTVETAYFGDLKRRGKRGVIRAYDTGLESGIGKYLISRIELEERKENAHNSAKRIANGATLTQVIDSRVQMRGKRFERFLDEKPIDISRGENLIIETDAEKMSKRYDWLMNQVAGALAEFVEYERKNAIDGDRILRFLRKSHIIENES